MRLAKIMLAKNKYSKMSVLNTTLSMTNLSVLRRTSRRNLLQKSLALLLAATTVAMAQKRAPSAPAPHPAAPAQHAPAAQHPSAPAGRSATPTRPQGGGAAQRSAAGAPRSGTMQGRPGAAGSAKPGAAGAGARPGAAGVRPGANASKPGAMGGKLGSASGTKTNAGGSRPGVGGHSAPRQVSLSHGGTARIGANGQIRSVNRNGMHIEHNMHGGRTIVSERGGKRIVTTGRHGGYVQKAYMTRGGHSYYQRTYFDHGHYHAGVYRGYSYGGHVYYGYYPTAYYSPAFYGWAYTPWADPVAWGVGLWGWAGAPWYGYYGFTPYPFYASPAFWLTDYLIAANLEAAFAALSEAPVVAAVASAGTPLRIVEREGGADSPIWTFNGSQGIGQFGTGNQPLTIESFDGGSIAVRRRDISGPWGGSALYVGQIAGNFVSGQVTYYDPNGGTRSGGWSGTILGFASVAAPAVAVTPTMPPVLNECEGGACGTWTWDGTHYNAVWGNGSVGVISLVRWDGSVAVLTRFDPTGTTAGITATYTGSIINQNTVAGSATYFWPGHPGGNHQQGWTANSPTPLLVAPAPAPAAVAGAPAAAPSGSEPVTLTPEVKQAIAEEVKAQLQAESAEAKSGASSGASQASAGEVPPALDPARRTFVVNADLALVADGQECSLTQGDVITRLTDTPDADQKVNVSVASSKKNDCAAGKMVSVSVDDLQEMRNHFSEQLDSGMKQLAAKQGTGKMPRSPSAATAAGAIPAPSPDTTAAQDLKDQQATADQTEQEVKQDAGGGQ